MADSDISDAALERALGRIWREGGAGTGASGLQKMLKSDTRRKVAIDRIRKWLSRREVGARLSRVNMRLADSLRTFDVRTPNALHHADTLTMPQDGASRSMLVVRDVATRFTDAEPLADKTAREAAIALEKIYSRNPRRLKPPRVLNVDRGTEFAGDFANVIANNYPRTELRVAKDTGDHKHASAAEAANRTIARRLFAYQHEAEQARGGVNRAWKTRLRTVLNRMNRTENEDGHQPEDILTGRKNATVSVKKLSAAARKWIANERDKAPLKQGQMVRVPLFRPADGGRWRATDLRLSSPRRITGVFAPIQHADAAYAPWEYTVGDSSRLWTRAHLVVVE